jgi:hypothetical protein
VIRLNVAASSSPKTTFEPGETVIRRRAEADYGFA